MENINVLIVDDRDIIRDSLKLSFLGLSDIKVTGEAEDGKEAIKLIKKNNYDVVVMDINMPGMNGIEATQEIVKMKPDIKILATSFHVSPSFIKNILKSGASGYIRKGENRNAYLDAIRTVSNGAIYLSEKVDAKVYAKVFRYLKHRSPVKRTILSI